MVKLSWWIINLILIWIVPFTLIAFIDAYSYGLSYAVMEYLVLALPLLIVEVIYFVVLKKRELIRVAMVCFLVYSVLYVLMNALPHLTPQVTYVVSPYARLLKYLGIVVIGTFVGMVALLTYRLVVKKEVTLRW